MSDRKKKLEEIRRKRAELERQLKEASGGALPTEFQTNSSSAASAANPESRYQTNASSSQYSSERKHRPSYFEDPVKANLMNEIQLKKLNESLRVYSFMETLIGIYPDLKDGFSQYELPPEFQQKQASRKQSTENKLAAENTAMKNLQRRFTLRTQSIDETTSKANKPVVLSDEKKKQLIESLANKFNSFIDTKSPIFQEALYANDIFDLCETYYDEDEEDMDLHKRNLVTPICEIKDESTEGRVVTSLEFSLRHQDTFLAAFSQTKDFHLQSGLIQLWSLANKKAPEYVINCQTEITYATFNNLNPKLIIGGSLTGQLLLWDIKSKPIPIQKTPLGIGGAKTHTHPITSVNIFGTENSNNIISLSSDGVLCQWSLSNMSRPVYRVELKRKRFLNENKDTKTQGLDEIGVLSTSFLPSNPSKMIIGSDDNDIYHISTVETETKENLLNTFKGQLGPVYSVDMHPTVPDVFISSGADWTTRLWSTNNADPLITFDMSDDYIYTSKWHPTIPSLFVSGDGTGKVDFWDLNKDREVPTFRYDMKSVINKLNWSGDGKKLIVGDANGRVSVFGVEKDLLNVKPEDVEKFNHVLANLQEEKSNVNNNN